MGTTAMLTQAILCPISREGLLWVLDRQSKHASGNIS
jgi:hypothetical protein